MDCAYKNKVRGKVAESRYHVGDGLQSDEQTDLSGGDLQN